MVDNETILDALAAGLSVKKAAKQFGVPEREVYRALREEVERCRDGERIREVWALEDRRLAAVGLRFYQLAMEGDHQAAVIYIKASERRATLNGANAPLGHAVTVMHQAAVVEQPSSLDKIERVLNELMIVDRSEKPH